MTRHRTHEDRAASSVLGSMTMVVLALIVAGVLGGVVFNQVQSVSDPPAPQADVTIEDADANYRPTDGDSEELVEIHHDRGEEIPAEDIKILVQSKADHSRVFTWQRGTITNDAGSGSWSISHNGASFDVDSRITRDDVVVISYEDAGGAPPAVPDDREYEVLVIHADSGTPIASTTLAIE